MTTDEFERWQDYLGATPRPDDFDEFWAARMAEADAVELRYTLKPAREIPSTDACTYYDLWFYGIDGERLYAKYLRPAHAVVPPVVLQFHGYPGATRSWFEQSSFVGMGCALIALDNPGQGGKSEDVGGYVGSTVSGHLICGLDGEPKEHYYVRLYQDVRILCRIVQELGARGEFDLTRVYVNGASQGAALGLACCALNPELISKAALLYPFLSDFRKVYELDLDVEAYEGIRYYARWFDPDGSRADEWFSKLAYIETNHFAHLVQCPVLFGTGLLDTVVPPQTQCAVYNELTCPKERYVFENFGHEEIQDFDDKVIDFFEGRCAHYYTHTLTSPEGHKLELRCVSPQHENAHKTVLAFHDCTRPARGWHHLSRYVGAGYTVVQLSNPKGAEPENFSEFVADALCAYDAVSELDGVDTSSLCCFGEGFGGALALAVAGMRPVERVAALNPYPTAPLMEQVPRISCPVLLGSSGMDELFSAADQDLLAARIAQLTHKHYPKFTHERINAFENEVLVFLQGH